MGEKVKIEKCVIQSILKLYGLDSEFTEQKEYIHYYDEYGYNVKIVLSVLLKSGQRVVIKIVNIKEDNLLEDGHKIEKQSAYSEFMRQSGIITPKYYLSNGKYCNVYVYNNIPCNVTVEDWCGEEITEINTDIAYKIGELMARMHILSLNKKYEIGCGTLFSAAYKNDVDAYDDFCKICENENLDQGVIEQIKKLHDEKLEVIRAVWDTLPKAAVQGDISINNLVYGEKELTVFDYNNPNASARATATLMALYASLHCPISITRGSPPIVPRSRSLKRYLPQASVKTMLSAGVCFTNSV